MQYFAKITNLPPHNNIVQEVLNVADSDSSTDGGVIKESIGAAFLETLTGHSNWIMCYKYSADRGVYPAPGDFWDSTNKIFYRFRPLDKDGWVCNSWTLNTTTGLWSPPIAKPTLTTSQDAANQIYEWDESLYEEDTGSPKTLGWVLLSL